MADTNGSAQQDAQAPSPRGSDDSAAAESEATENDSQTAERHKLRLRFGGFAVGASYTHFSGPIYPYYLYHPYAYYPGYWYGASFWSPIWSPYPYYGPGFFAYNSGRGEVRLSTDPKVAEVYIDGAYAGTADKLKSLWLDPGAYDLTMSSAGHEPFHRRVYVLSGKSLKITAKLHPESGKGGP